MSENVNPHSDTPADAAAAGGEKPKVTLSADDAVAAAAQAWTGTSSRNIPGLGELPIPDDTANLREGPSLHDGLLALLPLVGVWRGTGQADTEAGQYAFGQEIVFSHDGENYLKFESRTWKLDEEGNAQGPAEREVGFWRINLDDEIEVVLTHATGAVEIYYGQPINERAWQIESASTMVTATGPAALGPGKRLYGLMPNNNLGWVDERLVGEDMHPRMSAELQRVMG